MREKIRYLVECIRNPEQPGSLFIRRSFWVVVVVVGLTLVVVGTSYAQTVVYRDRVYPGVMVGEQHISGMNRTELKNFVENFNNRYAKEGIDLTAIDAQGTSHLLKFYTLIGAETPVEVARLDSDAFVDQSLAVGRGGGVFDRLFGPWKFLFKPTHSAIPLVVSESALSESLHNSLAGFEEPYHNATVIFESKTLAPTVVPEKSGLVYNYEALTERIKSSIATLSFLPHKVELQRFTPEITAVEVTAAVPRLEKVLAYGNIGFNHVDTQTKGRHDWDITPNEYKKWIEARHDEDNNIIFALSEEGVKKYLNEKIQPYVDAPAEEAKFVMEEGKVKEFTASRTGFDLNTDKTYQDFDTAFRARNYEPAEAIKTVGITVDIAEPKVKTADVNNLGISDIIGVGVSDFHGSTADRIRNLTTAVKRLNGLLIRPGEEFSTNKYAGPYDTEHGYVPEKVIKGREIKKEVGGGMCQIGTTLFRMAMNSGMPITERHNHSLVVHYYADPVNGNPGTDATVYDPLLDFKFLNDTGNYVLVQTAIDYKNLKLTFTLWGKLDGRKGWYSHPTVSKWYGAGKPEEIKVTDGSLKPGARRCELAYQGANASFTYSRVTTSGEQIDQKFDSYYRPLPQICMVGVDPNAPAPCPEGEVCEPIVPVPVDEFPSTTTPVIL